MNKIIARPVIIEKRKKNKEKNKEKYYSSDKLRWLLAFHLLRCCAKTLHKKIETVVSPPEVKGLVTLIIIT